MRSLIAAERAYRKSAGRTEALRLERNEQIREAIAAGHTQADIARATGLTTARVNQIVKGS